MYIYIYIASKKQKQFRPDPRNPQNRTGKAATDPADIVEQPQEIVDFQSRGGGPVGHPQGVQSKTLIFNIKYLPKASHPNQLCSVCPGGPLTGQVGLGEIGCGKAALFVQSLNISGLVCQLLKPISHNRHDGREVVGSIAGVRKRVHTKN